VIKRNIHNELISSLAQFPVVVLLGPRQVGKSTLAGTIASSAVHNAETLDLEKPSDRRKLEDAESFLGSLNDRTVILDEVQTMPELFQLMRPLVDEHRVPGRFLLLGSASPTLIKGVSESLAGRVKYLELTPLLLTEISTSISSLQQLWVRGGFPDSYLAKNEAASMAWRKAYLDSFIYRDLNQLFGTTFSPSLVQNFWSMLAHRQGQLFNAQDLAASLGVSGPTVARYLEFMEGAYMIRKLAPWHANLGKRLVKSPKTYVRDSGLLHALLDIDQHSTLRGHPVAGFSWEGFVVEQIIASLPAQLRPFFVRTHNGAEIDLLLVKNAHPFAAIEIKLSNAPTLSRGFTEACMALKVEHKYLLTPTSNRYVYKGATVCSLEAFIKEVLPGL
jgi:predicted AAA+ superfamily ATPase